MTEHDDVHLNVPQPIDLTALDPSVDAARFDRNIRAIAIAAMAARPRQVTVRPRGALAAIAQWTRPALAAAALLLIAGTATLLLMPTPAAAAPHSLAESAGIPRRIVGWSAGAHAPSATDWIELADSVAAATRGHR